MSIEHFYITRLSTGLGLIDETIKNVRTLKPGMDSKEFYKLALQSGEFPNISAQRLRNIVTGAFGPRYLIEKGNPAIVLKKLIPKLTTNELKQILFIYTCRANSILTDFITEVFWSCYSSGRKEISNEDASAFIIKAIHEGRMEEAWSDSTIKRNASYLTGACADFGLLEKGRRSIKKIVSFRIEAKVALFLAYDLHFSGMGDNSVISHSDWTLFGMDTIDVVEVLKQLSLRGFFIMQSAADFTRISWKYKDWEELIHAISQG